MTLSKGKGLSQLAAVAAWLSEPGQTHRLRLH